ncbi:hypothetical protein TB1_012620 [Malus domestica]
METCFIVPIALCICSLQVQYGPIISLHIGSGPVVFIAAALKTDGWVAGAIKPTFEKMVGAQTLLAHNHSLAAFAPTKIWRRWHRRINVGFQSSAPPPKSHPKSSELSSLSDTKP